MKTFRRGPRVTEYDTPSGHQPVPLADVNEGPTPEPATAFLPQGIMGQPRVPVFSHGREAGPIAVRIAYAADDLYEMQGEGRVGVHVTWYEGHSMITWYASLIEAMAARTRAEKMLQAEYGFCHFESTGAVVPVTGMLRGDWSLA